MRIRLVEPRAFSNTVYDHSRIPRLGLPQIGALLRRAGHDVRITVETLAPIDWDDLLAADLVGFSTTTSTTPPAYAMADRLRAAGRPVVFGGAHVTFLPDEAMAHADFVVRGEGHTTMIELVQALEGDGNVEAIAGLSYWRDGQIVHNAPRPNCDPETFANLPVPALELINGYENMGSYPVMTQWGCPYDCNFCSVIKMFGRRVRARRVEDVLDQLATIPAGRELFFYDDNFVVSKKRTKALLRGMRERGMVFAWSAQMRAEAIFAERGKGEWDTELLELMRDTGCDYVYIGFESANPEALAEYHKQQSVEQIAASIAAFHAYGIKVHGMFVVGCDADTPEAIHATVDFAIRHEIDTVQFLTITPLPGTEFYYQMEAEGRILSRDWSLYDGHHALIAPKHMSAYDLQRASLEGMLRFYAPRRAFGPLIRNMLHEAPFLWQLYWREHRIRVVLPEILKMAADAHRAVNIPGMLQSILPLSDWQRLRKMFAVPLFRRYALIHTRQGLHQPENRRYFEWLRALAQQAGLTAARRANSQS